MNVDKFGASVCLEVHFCCEERLGKFSSSPSTVRSPCLPNRRVQNRSHKVKVIEEASHCQIQTTQNGGFWTVMAILWKCPSLILSDLYGEFQWKYFAWHSIICWGQGELVCLKKFKEWNTPYQQALENRVFYNCHRCISIQFSRHAHLIMCMCKCISIVIAWRK